MIKRLGHNVHILESNCSSLRDGQAAGISAGAQMQKFLESYDLLQDPYFVPASGLQITNRAFEVQEFRKIPFRMTSWNVLYYRLRANYDSFQSEYYPTPPEMPKGDGKAIYDVGKRVTDVSYVDGIITLTFDKGEAELFMQILLLGRTAQIQAFASECFQN